MPKVLYKLMYQIGLVKPKINNYIHLFAVLSINIKIFSKKIKKYDYILFERRNAF